MLRCVVAPRRVRQHDHALPPTALSRLSAAARAQVAGGNLVDSAFGLRVGFSLTRPPRDSPLLLLGTFHETPNERAPNVANIKSQIKRNKTNEKARERNKAVKSQLKTEVRRTREAIAAGDKAAAEKALATATKKLDKAVSKGVIHENQAANRKSAIAKQVAAL